MSALLESLSDLHHIHDDNQLYLFVLNRCSDVLKAQGGTFFSVHEDVGELRPQAAKGVSLSLLREIPFKMKSGIAGWVATNRRPVVVENAQVDNRFNRAVDVITGIRTRSVVCVPVIRQDKVLAIVELVNRVDGIFREADLEFLQHLANQVGIALENCRLYREMSELLGYTNSVLNSLSGGFISVNVHGVVNRCNASACRILGIGESDVLGKEVVKAISQYPTFGSILDAAQRHQSPSTRQEIELHKPDGSTMLIGYSIFLIRNEQNTGLGAGMIFQDITNLKRI